MMPYYYFANQDYGDQVSIKFEYNSTTIYYLFY